MWFCVASPRSGMPVTRPTRLLLNWVKQTFPSGPGSILVDGSPFGPSENSVTVPAGVTRATAPTSVNHTLPSGPTVMEFGVAPPEIPLVMSGRCPPA